MMLTSDAVQSRQHAIWYYKEVSDSSLGLNLGTFSWFLLIFLDSSLILPEKIFSYSLFIEKVEIRHVPWRWNRVGTGFGTGSHLRLDRFLIWISEAKREAKREIRLCIGLIFHSAVIVLSAQRSLCWHGARLCQLSALDAFAASVMTTWQSHRQHNMQQNMQQLWFQYISIFSIRIISIIIISMNLFLRRLSPQEALRDSETNLGPHSIAFQVADSSLPLWCESSHQSRCRS